MTVTLLYRCPIEADWTLV